MRNFLIVVMTISLFLVVALPPACAQSNDLSVWDLHTERGGYTPYVQYLHVGGKVVAFARYNYDAPRTAGLCAGPKIGHDSFAIVPEACGYYGKTRGYGPEVLLFSETRMVSFVQQTQYFLGTAGARRFVYDFTDLRVKMGRHLSAGAYAQFFNELGQKPQTDVGPSGRVNIGKAYVFISPMASASRTTRGQKTVLIGLGYTW